MGKQSTTPRFNALSWGGILSFILAVICCPLVLLPTLFLVHSWVNAAKWTYVAGTRNDGDAVGEWFPYALFIVMGISTAISLILVLLALKRDDRKGIGLPVCSLVLMALWWLVIWGLSQLRLPGGGRY